MIGRGLGFFVAWVVVVTILIRGFRNEIPKAVGKDSLEYAPEEIGQKTADDIELMNGRLDDFKEFLDQLRSRIDAIRTTQALHAERIERIESRLAETEGQA